MKTLFLTLSCIAALTATQGARAAVTVSNLDEPAINDDGWAVFLNEWVGMSFTVGTASAYWNLDSVDLRAWRGGLGGDFNVALHSDAGGEPGAQIVVFNGPDPVLAPATYSYSPVSATTLAAGVTYWITSSSIAGNYAWVNTDPLSTADTGVDGWSIGDDVAFSTDQGGSWLVVADEPSMMAISATAIPEPAATLNAGLAVLGLLLRRRRAC